MVDPNTRQTWETTTKCSEFTPHSPHPYPSDTEPAKPRDCLASGHCVQCSPFLRLARPRTRFVPHPQLRFLFEKMFDHHPSLRIQQEWQHLGSGITSHQPKRQTSSLQAWSCVTRSLTFSIFNHHDHYSHFHILKNCLSKPWVKLLDSSASKLIASHIFEAGSKVPGALHVRSPKRAAHWEVHHITCQLFPGNNGQVQIVYDKYVRDLHVCYLCLRPSKPSANLYTIRQRGIAFDGGPIALQGFTHIRWPSNDDVYKYNFGKPKAEISKETVKTAGNHSSFCPLSVEFFIFLIDISAFLSLFYSNLYCHCHFLLKLLLSYPHFPFIFLWNLYFLFYIICFRGIAFDGGPIAFAGSVHKLQTHGAPLHKWSWDVLADAHKTQMLVLVICDLFLWSTLLSCDVGQIGKRGRCTCIKSQKKKPWRRNSIKKKTPQSLIYLNTSTPPPATPTPHAIAPPAQPSPGSSALRWGLARMLGCASDASASPGNGLGSKVGTSR